MKKIMMLLVLMAFVIAACSEEEAPKTTDSGSSASAETSNTDAASSNTATGAVIVELGPINVNCDSLFNSKTLVDLTPSKKVSVVEIVENLTVDKIKTVRKKKETKVEDGPSEFADSKLETKTLTFDHKTISEQSCEFAPTSKEKRVGTNTLNLRLVCGPKDEASQKFNDEKTNSRSVEDGATGQASFWGVKNEQVVYSLLSGKVDCFVDVEGVNNLKIGEELGKEIEGKLS